MRIGILSDIHANWEALQAVWQAMEQAQVESVYCLGDVIGYGADPSACVDFVQAKCNLVLQGNHEAVLLDPSRQGEMNNAAAAALLWTRQQLSPQQRQILKDWPLVQVHVDSRLVHGSPFQPAEFYYILNRLDLNMAFEAFSELVCFYGHTHQPGWAEKSVSGVIRFNPAQDFSLNPEYRYLINVGSVGQPRNGDPRAQWVLITDQPPRISFQLVSYDIQTAQKKIKNAGLPMFLAERLAYGR